MAFGADVGPLALERGTGRSSTVTVVLSMAAVQCATNTGTVMLASSVRLAPPRTISRMREWP
mgnify:CR=1 FL=1